MRVLVARVPLDRSGLIGLPQFEAFCTAGIRARLQQQQQQQQQQQEQSRASGAGSPLKDVTGTGSGTSKAIRHSTDSLPSSASAPRLHTGSDKEKRLSLTGGSSGHGIGSRQRRRSSLERDREAPLAKGGSSLSVVRQLARQQDKAVWEGDDGDAGAAATAVPALTSSRTLSKGKDLDDGGVPMSSVQLTPITHKRTVRTSQRSSVHWDEPDSSRAEKAGGNGSSKALDMYSDDDDGADVLSPMKPEKRPMSPISPLIPTKSVDDYVFPSVAKPSGTQSQQPPAPSAAKGSAKAHPHKDPAMTAVDSLAVTKVRAAVSCSPLM